MIARREPRFLPDLHRIQIPHAAPKRSARGCDPKANSMPRALAIAAVASNAAPRLCGRGPVTRTLKKPQP
jgi:hypothetical protein